PGVPRPRRRLPLPAQDRAPAATALRPANTPAPRGGGGTAQASATHGLPGSGPAAGAKARPRGAAGRPGTAGRLPPRLPRQDGADPADPGTPAASDLRRRGGGGRAGVGPDPRHQPGPGDDAVGP